MCPVLFDRQPPKGPGAVAAYPCPWQPTPPSPSRRGSKTGMGDCASREGGRRLETRVTAEAGLPFTGRLLLGAFQNVECTWRGAALSLGQVEKHPPG